jgi:hypothetical protein
MRLEAKIAYYLEEAILRSIHDTVVEFAYPNLAVFG